MRKGACVWISVACARVKQGPPSTDWSGLGTGNGTMDWAARVALLYSGIYSEDMLCVLVPRVDAESITQPAAREQTGNRCIP